MKIKDFKIWNIDIPLKINFKHSLAQRSTSASLIIKITLDNDISGYGEALPREYVTGETIDSSIEAIKNLILPELIDKDFNDFKSLKKEILALHKNKKISHNLTAICAVELALMDALSKSNNQNIYQFLNLKPKVPKIYYSMVLSSGNLNKIKKYTWISRIFNIKDLKLKVTDSVKDNEEMIKNIKTIYPNSNLRVDANCAWDLDSAFNNLKMMKKYNIISCEQALNKNDIDGHAKIVSAFPDILICIDESLCSYEDAKNFIEKKAATSFNIRISKNGGLINSLGIYELAKKNGIHCQLGAQVGETAVMSAFGRIFAAITGDMIFHEGSFGSRLLKKDITPINYSFNLIKGKAYTEINGKGLNIPINENIITMYS